MILGCAPPPGTYDPKSPGPKALKGTKFNKAERFKKPFVPQVSMILLLKNLAIVKSIFFVV